jgi:hypothetical protein
MSNTTQATMCGLSDTEIEVFTSWQPTICPWKIKDGTKVLAITGPIAQVLEELSQARDIHERLLGAASAIHMPGGVRSDVNYRTPRHRAPGRHGPEQACPARRRATRRQSRPGPCPPPIALSTGKTRSRI